MKTQTLSALDTPGGFDVCIVGSGPAGTFMVRHWRAGASARSYSNPVRD